MKLPPVHPIKIFGGEATSIPAGKLSVKFKLNISPVFAELSMVKVNVLRSPKLTLPGLKFLEKPGRLVATDKFAVATPLLPELEFRSPVVFVCVPSVLLVTSTVIIQDCPPPTVPPV